MLSAAYFEVQKCWRTIFRTSYK